MPTPADRTSSRKTLVTAGLSGSGSRGARWAGGWRRRREFCQRCADALRAAGALIAAYDRIEAQASVARRTARSQAQAAREQQASARLHALSRPTPPPPAPEAPMTVPEQSPHCRQPVTVIIVPG